MSEKSKPLKPRLKPPNQPRFSLMLNRKPRFHILGVNCHPCIIITPKNLCSSPWIIAGRAAAAATLRWTADLPLSAVHMGQAAQPTVIGRMQGGSR